nr:ribonuclease H-like domain-containing protein [Tanacetum cinerariifolium]
MGDENPIRTLGDYSKPSHGGYRNTIELPVGNNVVPLQFDTIRIDLWLQVKIFYDHIDHTLKRTMDYATGGRLRKLEAKSYLDDNQHSVSTTLRTISKRGIRESCDEFILDEKEKVKQLEEYMGVIGSDFILPLVRESTFGFKPGTRNNRNIKSRHDPNPQSTPQVHRSFKENTTPVTYPDEIEEIIGIPIEVEPLDKTPLEDLGLNTCNHDIPLSSREIPNFDETKPKPHPLPNYPPLDVSLESKKGLKPPIKPHSLDSFKMNVIDNLTIHIPPSPHVAPFHLKDMYCYHHPCLGDPKKHYGFKPGKQLIRMSAGNVSSKTKNKFSQSVETASRFTRYAITTTPVTGSGYS